MTSLDVGTDDQMAYVRTLAANQRKCIYNAIPWPGYQDVVDQSMHMYFDWQWRNKLAYEEPPANYQIPNLPADSGVQVKIKSVYNNQYLSSPTGLIRDAWVYAKAGSGAPLEMTLVGSKAVGFLRMAQNPDLFLSYDATSGAVKLWAPGSLEPTDYQFATAGPGWGIMNIYWKQYMNLDTGYQSPYINRYGDPANAKSQWYIDGLPR